MGAILGIVSAISAEVVAELAAANYPPLRAGKILLGRRHQTDEDTPPRVIFIPMKSKFGPKDPRNPTGAMAPIQQRAIATDSVMFEVRCWSGGDAGDTFDDDIDATQALYDAVILVTHRITYGAFRLSDGEWVDAKQGTKQHNRLGQEFVFGLSFDTPVLDKLLPRAPSGVQPGLTNTMQIIGGVDGSPGGSGVGCG